MAYHEDCGKDEKFVGNISAGDKLLDLEGIQYRIGTQAYDIHGEKLNKNYMLPLFIKNNSLQKYDDIMMAQHRAIRAKY